MLNLSSDIKLPASVISMDEMLVGLSRTLGCTFQLGGKPVEARAVFAPNALLPVLAMLAQDGGQRYLDADFGCVLKRDDPATSFFAARCVVPPVTGHIADVMRALFFAHHATDLLGMEPEALIELEPFFEDIRQLFKEHMNSFDVPVEIGEVMAWPLMSRAV